MSRSDHETKRPYQRFYRAAPLDRSYPSSFRFKLVSSMEDLKEALTPYADTPQDRRILAYDCETTGLDLCKDHMVGFSFCYEPTTAYYVPIRHLTKNSVNVPLDCVRVIYEVMLQSKEVAFFNAEFDLRMLEKEKFDIWKVPLYDVTNPVWVLDTNIRMPSLKESALWFLGWRMPTYLDTAGNENFQDLDPVKACPYAAGDALVTLHLRKKVGYLARDHTFIVDLDNSVTLPIMLMEDTPVRLDRDRLKHLGKEVKERLRALEKEAHEAVGAAFNLNSPTQVGEILQQLGLSTGRFTKKTRRMKVDIAALEEIAHFHPVIEKIVEFKHLGKLSSSYIKPLLDGYREDLQGVRFKYNRHVVPTGRLSSSGDKENSYYAKVNAQNIPKPHACYYSVQKDPGHPDNILGYVFTLIGDHKALEVWREQNPEISYTEGMDPKLNIRCAFLPHNDHLWLSCDYSGQELRLPANFSNEPVWVGAFLEGEDLHKNTAVRIYGAENYNRDKRKTVKALNFGALYGGTASTFARTLRCSRQEAQDLLEQWWFTLRGLKAWTRTVKAKAKKYGYTSSAFGRPRRVRHWLASSKWGERTYAERAAVNQEVQGTAADMIRLAICRTVKKIYRKGVVTGEVYPYPPVHDELNSSVHKDRVVEVARQKCECMNIKIPSWKVPMEVGIEVGRSWGALFKFEFKGDTLVPVLEEPE